jgi:hypothetical protein
MEKISINKHNIDGIIDDVKNKYVGYIFYGEKYLIIKHLSGMHYGITPDLEIITYGYSKYDYIKELVDDDLSVYLIGFFVFDSVSEGKKWLFGREE